MNPVQNLAIGGQVTLKPPLSGHLMWPPTSSGFTTKRLKGSGNGEIWEVGLKRFAEMIPHHPLKLVLAPLRGDTDIYLECKPNFVNGIVAALDGIEAIVQYQFDNVT
jgi:hypothetical protein